MNARVLFALLQYFIICEQTRASTNLNKFPYFREIKRDFVFENLAVDLAYKWKDVTCLNIILDHFHDGILDKLFYKAVTGIPFFKIVVNDTEDLASPNFLTWQILNQVRKEGCNMNIIFLLNADQTIRLLTFSDKHRLLDSRTRFMLLHDRRLFVKQYHTLWTKIINVVFIRKYRSKEIYELSTVPFPVPIKGTLVTLRLDLWIKRKFQKQNDLYRDKVSDLQGNSLRVVTFNYIPSAIKESTINTNDDVDNSGYSKGLEIEVLNSLGSAMNFIPAVYEPMNWRTEQWGRKQINGSLSGLLGEVWSANADLALGNLHYTPYHLNILDLSIPYNTECLTFLTFESKTDNSWKTLILPFRLNMWVGVVITLLIGGFLFYALATAHKHIEDSEEINEIINDTFRRSSEKRNLVPINKNTSVTHFLNVVKNQLKKLKVLNNKNVKQQTSMVNCAEKQKFDQFVDHKDVVGLYLFEDIGNSILYTYGMLVAVSLPKVPSGWAIRMLTGWWWIYCLLVAVAYKASMTAILANPDTRITIDTLEALADSNVDCGGWGEQPKEFFMTSLDKTGQRVGQKFQEVYDIDEAIDRVSKGQFAYYDNIYFLRYVKLKQNTKTYEHQLRSINDTQQHNIGTLNGTSKGDFTLHIMANCIINMPISLGLQKNSPIKPAVDRFLRRVIEAGLVKKWLNDVILDTIALEVLQEKEETKALMDLKKLYGAFVVLFAGYILSILVLLFELCYWYGVIKKDPMFDEYSLNCYYAHQRR